MKVWILTGQVNEYDQHGEYFVAAFKEKPTATQIKAADDTHSVEHSYDFIPFYTEGDPPSYYAWVAKTGGGRLHNGWGSWLNLREIDLT